MKNFRTHVHAAMFAATMVTGLAADELAPGRPFHPPPNTSGVVRIWGNPQMAGLVRAWVEGFQRTHPAAQFAMRLAATGLAMPGLYTGAADIALFGRDTNTTDNDGFEHVLNYKPLRVEFATGSLDAPGKSCALAVFVHRDNPLVRLTLAQLDAIFGDELRRGLAPIRTWGQLGLTGEWTARPISLYGYDSRSGPGVFFAHVTLKDSQKMNWPHFAEFSDRRNSGGSLVRAGTQAVAALVANPAGIAIATLSDATPGVKMLALAVDERGPFFAPTRESLITRRYPLARPIFACLNRPPGAQLDPNVKEFLLYVLSPDGQQGIERAGGYLPLAPPVAETERRKLD
jgi:phosphate transport system substrate-binding protein